MPTWIAEGHGIYAHGVLCRCGHGEQEHREGARCGAFSVSSRIACPCPVFVGQADRLPALGYFRSKEDAALAARAVRAHEPLVALAERLLNRWANTRDGSVHRIIDDEDASDLRAALEAAR